MKIRNWKRLAGLLWVMLLAWCQPAVADDALLATEWNAAVLDVAEAEDGFMTCPVVKKR